ncbi:MAG: methyl-accepting chemotaxis protein [Rhodobacteraceae bacterium]|nr:MAG: methyl-accepting chemotaxis protein [Paracoccaceae bacterium]
MALPLARLRHLIEMALTRPADAASTEAVRVLARMCTPLALALVGLVALLDGALPLALAGGVLFATMGGFAPRLPQSLAAIVVGQALVGLTITLNTALTGLPLHLDTNMLFFAMLASIVIMSDFRALFWAAVTISIHHAVLLGFAPTLVFPDADLGFNLSRLAFHSVISLLEFLALGYMLARRHELSALAANRTEAAQEAARKAQDALSLAESEKTRAEQALVQAQKAGARAAKAQKTAETALRDNQEARAERQRLRERGDAERAQRETALDILLTVFEAHLEDLAKGNLSTRINEELDDAYLVLRDSFNQSMATLGAAIEDVRTQSGEMQGLSGEIAASATDLAGRTERQAATLADVARTVNTLAGSLSETTSREAAEGVDIVQQAVEAMQDIERSAGEIDKITSVIDDIAFQTNLLALNAGVEAARAGEAGRGFAIVASEVRALAQRSSNAAREINQFILRSNQQVQSGADLVRRTGAALGGIKTSVDTITGRLHASARAVQSQSDHLARVNRAISDLETVTQQNAAMFEETTAANTQLSERARVLSDLVQTFVTARSRRSAQYGARAFPPPSTAAPLQRTG